MIMKVTSFSQIMSFFSYVMNCFKRGRLSIYQIITHIFAVDFAVELWVTCGARRRKTEDKSGLYLEDWPIVTGQVALRSH